MTLTTVIVLAPIKSFVSIFCLQGGTQLLSQLLHHVAMSHRRHASALLVGYSMKPSRERNLASRGLLPLTAPHGVCFVPIDFALPLQQQGPFDILLHKVDCPSCALPCALLLLGNH